MTILENRYGKSRVRVARLIRQKDHHDFYEMTVGIQLEGDFDSSYTHGDNSRVLPTDTMKNTVYALAKDDAVTQPESFALLLARHFLEGNSQVARVHIDVAQRPWQRHGRFSFVAGGAHRRMAFVNAARDAVIVEGGVRGYVLLKTSGSAFEGFLKDRFTTLKETGDRILSTSLDARWRYRGGDISPGSFTWDSSWHGVMKLITDTFAEHDSASVQHTLYAAGEAVIAHCDHIQNIRLVMPNRHYLLVNTEPLGVDNVNEIFCPTDEPHGLIEAVISR
jgi:urate oxidase